MTWTLSITTNTHISFSDYVFPLTCATTDVSTIVLMLFIQFGALGNNIFFVCSAWFLVGRDNFSRKKAFSLLCTVWTVSICILVFFLGVGSYNISLKEIVKQILPTTFSNNWYATCYIIFLFVYPYLNMLIALVDQKKLLRIVLFSSLLWVLATYVKSDLFFTSSLTLWVTVYFLMAYLKLYCRNSMSSLNVGIGLVIVGSVGFVGQIVVTNFIGLHIVALSNQVLRWNKNCSPFYIMIAIGSLINTMHSHLKTRCINYVSSLTLFIYLIHDNYLLRTYTYPTIWQWIYTTYGYGHVVLLNLGFSVVLFLASLFISAVYKETIQRLVTKVSDKLYFIVSKAYGKVEHFILGKID